MRTNIDLDDALVREAFKYVNVKTKRELVHLGLKELIENHRRKNIGDLKGKIVFADDYDYKALRVGGKK